MSNYKTRIETAIETATADLTEHERHYANMFYQTLLGAGLSALDARFGCLVEIYRERALRASQGLSANDCWGDVQRARRWQSDLCLAMPGDSRWSDQQRFERPDEFKRNMAGANLAGLTEALDAVGLVFFTGGYVVVAAETGATTGPWSDRFDNMPKKQVENAVKPEQKCVSKKTTQMRRKALTVAAPDMFG